MARERGELGEPQSVVFFLSAYAFHGMATAKAILGTRGVMFARRRRLNGHFAVRTIHFWGGKQALVFEPPDFRSGCLASRAWARLLKLRTSELSAMTRPPGSPSPS